VTVGELIEKLEGFPSNLPVVIYEDTEMGDCAEVGTVTTGNRSYWYDHQSGSALTVKRGGHVWLEP
jgi:hypothetical protein